MFRMTEEGKVNYYAHLWALANLSMWYDLWFSGSSKKPKLIMNKILITGGAGFIGSKIIYRILNNSQKSKIIVLTIF